jgi:gliding motility-associated-like protein
MNKGENDFEDLFKESFEKFEADVNPTIWENIQTGLKGAGIGVLIQTIFNKIGSTTIVATVSSVSAVIATVLVMNFTNKPKTPEVQSKLDKTVVKADKASVKEIKKFLSDGKGTAETKPVSSEPVADNKAAEEAKAAESMKTNKTKIQSVIKSLSGQPVASISATPVAGTVPLIVNLNNVGIGKINKWTFGDKQRSDNSSNPVHVFETPGVYTIVLTSTSSDGRTSTDSVKIEATGNSSILIPNSFSPNGDGKDDLFVFNSKNINSMEVLIFDTKGRTIFRSKGIDCKWDGKNQQGKMSQEGIYYYMVSAIGGDGKKYEQKGSIQLIR